MAMEVNKSGKRKCPHCGLFAVNVVDDLVEEGVLVKKYTCMKCYTVWTKPILNKGKG